MSVRELIAANIKTAITAMTSPVAAVYVTREPFDFQKLSNAQFPAVLIETASETRADITIGESLKRHATIDYRIIGYVKGASIDTARNNLIEAIEEKLDADRTRGGNAIDTQTVSVDIDNGSITPIGGIILTVRVTYQFTRGIS